MISRASTPHERDESERELVQRRMALFFKGVFIVSASTDLLDVATEGIEGETLAQWILSFLVTACFGALWFLSWVRSWSLPSLRTLDAVGTGAAAVVIGLMGRSLATEEPSAFFPSIQGALLPEVQQAVTAATDAHVAMLLVLGGSIMYTFRAAVVPSPPLFTLFVTGVLGAPFVLVPTLLPPGQFGELALRQNAQWSLLFNYLIWWTIVAGMCTAASAVIYGLRRQVREARRLGQYTLMEKLGEGGMGMVYRARHARLRRPTAVKLLPPGRLTEAAIARFESEVQLTAELTHPNTITVFDYGRTDDGIFYYAMEFLDGATLNEVVAIDGAQPAARVIRVLSQAAGALQEAHEVGLVHRDIKPANIMLTRQGGDRDAVKLLDFGLVRPVERDRDASVTHAEQLLGTPQYMAPELIGDSKTASAASDLYSLGAVGYYLATGSHVFEGHSLVEVCAHHLHSEPETPSQRSPQPVPPLLDQLLLRCLAKSPAERPQSAAELLSLLEEAGRGLQWSAADAIRWWEEHRQGLSESRRSREQSVHPVRLTVVER